MVCALETNAVSLERIFEYSSEGEEAAWQTEQDSQVRGGENLINLSVFLHF